MTSAGSRPRSWSTTGGARLCSPTRPSATPTNSARATVMAGPRTRRGNIRCRSERISALSCAARVSSSTDLALERLEHVQPERAREVARFAALVVDLCYQSAQRKAAGLRQGGQLAPEGVLERDA